MAVARKPYLLKGRERWGFRLEVGVLRFAQDDRQTWLFRGRNDGLAVVVFVGEAFG